MKIDRNTQIPNKVVYGVLYAILFGISIWLLAFHKENPTNWLLYVGMILAVLAGLLHFGLHSRKRHQ
jgi:DMSO reductase anchor subunit